MDGISRSARHPRVDKSGSYILSALRVWANISNRNMPKVCTMPRRNKPLNLIFCLVSSYLLSFKFFQNTLIAV